MSVALQFELFGDRRPDGPWWPWQRVPKGDIRCRKMADRHYTRQTPGHPQWTRPGFTFVLYASDAAGQAVWCWWRPKWEAGIERGDGLRALECTIFRREGLAVRASDLVRAAVAALDTDQAARDLRLDAAGPIRDGLITGIATDATARGRSKRSLPGECYRRADVWLISAGVLADVRAAEIADVKAGYPPRRWRCPECGAEHSRGHFGSLGVHRCLHCGYVGDGGVLLEPGDAD